MRFEDLRKEVGVIDLNLRIVTQLAEDLGVFLMETSTEDNRLGSISHLKGYKPSITLAEELPPESQIEVIAHLLAHFALGHTSEEGQQWIQWQRGATNTGNSCLDSEEKDPEVIQQETDAHAWAQRILTDREFYRQEKIRLQPNSPSPRPSTPGVE